MKVIVGSHDLWPSPSIASKILALMVSTDEPFAIRASNSDRITSGVEELVERIGPRVGREVQRFAAGTGSNAGFLRDVSLAAHASEVHAFFAPGRLMEGGTGHVVACALREGKPVIAYELNDKGEVIETASDAGDLMQMYTEEPAWQ